MDKKIFTPIYNYVLILLDVVSNVTPSGLALPESSVDKPNQGRVVEVGDGQLDSDGKVIPVRVKKDDHVVFPKYAGQELRLNGTKYVLMRDTDIWGILSE